MLDTRPMRRRNNNRYKKKKQKHRIKASKVNENNNMTKKKPVISSTILEKQETVDSRAVGIKPIQPNGINAEKETESNNKGSKLNKKYSLAKYLWSGACGALVTLGLVILVAFIIPGFRYTSYYVNEDPTQLTQLLSCNLTEKDSLNVANAIIEETARRNEMIEDLLYQGVILSSEDFASNLSGYYNALIAVLAAVLVILNLFGFLAWRSNAADALEQEKRKLSYEIDNIDKRLQLNLEEILKNNQTVREKLESYFQRMIDQDNHLEDEEWEKLRLLLKKYEYTKKEVLVEINAEEDDNDNDGLIEEV